MYNFAKQKDMNGMLDEFEHYCESVEEIKLNTTENKIDKYDCQYELGIILYYLQGEAVAYIDDENTLYILEQGIEYKKTLDIVAKITHELQQTIYLEFENNAEYFAKDINRHMYKKSDYIKEQGLSIEEQEELDLKEWKKEEARQAYAMNRGML